MITESIQAWLLCKKPTGDTSIRLSLFTRERGIIQALYRSGRKPHRQGMIQPFIPLWLALNQRHDYYYVKNCEATQPSLHFMAHALFSALYINELVYYSLRLEDPYPELFDDYQKTLVLLAQSTDNQTLETHLRRFEWNLLQCCGYGLVLDIDASTEKSINAHQRYAFKPGLGLVPAEEGIFGSIFLSLAKQEFHQPQVLRIAKAIMRQAIDHFLGGREIKSRYLFIRPKSL